MLKPLLYQNSGWHKFSCIERYATIVYAIMPENRIVFSGTDPGPGRTSTINAAEVIMMEICNHEGIEPTDFTFCDLSASHKR